jgi:hypothetical protein
LDVFSGAVKLEVILVTVAIDMAVGATRAGGFAAVGIVTAFHTDLLGIPSSPGRAGRFLRLVAIAPRLKILVVLVVHRHASILVVGVSPAFLVSLSPPLGLVASVAGALSLHLRLESITIFLVAAALGSLVVASRNLPSLSIVVVLAGRGAVVEVTQVILKRPGGLSLFVETLVLGTWSGGSDLKGGGAHLKARSALARGHHLRLLGHRLCLPHLVLIFLAFLFVGEGLVGVLDLLELILLLGAKRFVLNLVGMGGESELSVSRLDGGKT